MRRFGFTLAACLIAGAASPAAAQSTTDTAGPFPVTGNVPALCTGGTVAGSGSFDLGVLIDTSTGLLRTDLSAPPQVVTGAFCSARSTISISATPLLTVNNTGTPPSGFSRRVDYNATASGWTTTPAVFSTAAAANPGAVQERETAFQGDITVAVDAFSTGGGNALRLVADTEYEGAVVVTLAVDN